MEKFYQKLFFTFILGLHRMYTTRVPYCVCKGTHYSRNAFPRMFRIFLFSYKHSFFPFHFWQEKGLFSITFTPHLIGTFRHTLMKH